MSSNHSASCDGDFSSAFLVNFPLSKSTSPRTRLPRRRAATRKSALILRLLRQRARGRRNKKPQTFYSIRAVAHHFGVPPTTVSRIYAQLRSEGLLTPVWGSKTLITPTRIDNELRIRGVVALPVSLTSFCTLREYRNFFLEMRDALWKFGFATQLLFCTQNDAHLPMFAEGLLKYRPDIVIWFLPTAKLKQTIARVLDRGIRVVTVGDGPADHREHCYSIDRGQAIKDALIDWQRNGIRSVTVMQDCCCGSTGTTALVEKCLRDAAMPHTYAKIESWQGEQTFPPAQQIRRGIIFPCSDLAAALVAQNPACFAKSSEQSRVLLIDGPIDVPGMYAAERSSDVLQLDLQPIAKRIVSDLIQSRSRRAVPVTFQAKWVPRPIENRATSIGLSAAQH
jgi:hypothetical protein